MSLRDFASLIDTDATSVYPFLTQVVARFKPRVILELGTGDGHSAAAMLQALPADGVLTTVNWPNPPSGDDGWRMLHPYRGDARLRYILGDSLEVRDRIVTPIDLLFLDCGTEHTCRQTSAEWALYEPCMAPRGIVLVDDINHGDMRDFWDPLPYRKAELTIQGPHGFGIFYYMRGKRGRK